MDWAVGSAGGPIEQHHRRPGSGGIRCVCGVCMYVYVYVCMSMFVCMYIIAQCFRTASVFPFLFSINVHFSGPYFWCLFFLPIPVLESQRHQRSKDWRIECRRFEDRFHAVVMQSGSK